MKIGQTIVVSTVRFDEVEINALMDLVLKYRERNFDNNFYLRLDKARIPVGTVLRKSRVLVDGKVTKKVLSGTSCFAHKYRSPKSFNAYHADEAYLVTGDSTEEGNDVGEVVVKNCTVVASLKNGLPDES